MLSIAVPVVPLANVKLLNACKLSDVNDRFALLLMEIEPYKATPGELTSV